MKKIQFLIIVCLLILGITESCKSKFDEKKYLTQILNNLEQVKSASYFLTATSSMPNDTMLISSTKTQWYYKEFANPADTAVGISNGCFYPTDTTKMLFSYDGNARIYIYNNNKRVEIDSFKVDSWPFRRQRSFFYSIKNIINYTFTTNDSILTEFHDFGDSLLFRLNIYSDMQQVVLVYKRPMYVDGVNTYPFFDNNPTPRDEILEHKLVRYDVWINKSNGLPYKLKMTDQVSVFLEELSDIQINTMDINDFVQSRYIPADYDIYVIGQGRITPPDVNLTGKPAPNWTLSDSNNEQFALKDFKSKVLLLKFTGIGCGPCHASLPFLKQLITDYKDKSLELVSIECWNDNIDVIKRYCSINDINYKYLISNEEIRKTYNPLGAVPVFFILDNNRLIQKVVRGYSTELEKEIREAIEKLL